MSLEGVPLPARTVVAVYAAAMAVLTVAFYSLPAWHLVFWSSLTAVSAGAIVVGVLRYRPGLPVAWWLLAAAVTVFGAGDTTYNVLTTVLGVSDPFPSLADVFYLAMYPIMATGLMLVVRRRTGGRDRGSLLDALSVTTALAPLSWMFLIDPYVRDPDLTWLERATSIAYPLGDVLILVTLARLLMTTRRSPAAALLGLGAAGLLGSDVLYGVLQLAGTWQIGSAYDLGWVVFYGAWGAAALHPSMVDLTRATRSPADEMGFGRVALLVAVSLVAPGAVLLDTLVFGAQHGVLIAGSSAVLFLLVLTRLSGVMLRHRQAVERERALRAAGAALMSAADLETMAAAVRDTVVRLVPAGTPHCALLVTDGLVVGRSTTAAGSGAASELVAGAALRGAAAERAADFPTALVCPLRVDDRPAAGPPPGHIVVASAETVLLTLQGALEVLASQVALAVERVALAREITARESEAYFRTLVQNAQDVILITDDAGLIRYASPSAGELLGPGPMAGRRLTELFHPADRDVVERELLTAPVVGADARDVRVVRPDGTRVNVAVVARDLRHDATIHGVVLTLQDVTEQRRLERELTHRAFHDALTGLPNRTLFRERVEQALAAPDSGLVGLLLVDLDDFKLVNDTMGHSAGDELLIVTAERLTGILRPDDTAARLGGDEFAILVGGCAEVAGVEEVAARVVGALAAPYAVAAGLSTSASVGVATSPGSDGAAEMLRQADLALYAAKAAGKGLWRAFEPSLHFAALDRLEVRTELDRAIAAGAFQLLYQPIIDLDRGRMTAVEALVRWHHPRRGLVSPMDFIPIAEETGLIVPLGAWVLERALADLTRWRRAGAALTVNINVSACEIRAPGFLERLVEALERWQVPAESLVLEITETALLADDADVAADLAALRGLGLRIAIDDFGTGWSSLDYVRLHAIDVLKIDRSFIDRIEVSGRRAAIVSAIVHLARALKLSVVAEGVETAEQRDTLILSGCTLGQGYLFSRPVGADAILPWLAESLTGREPVTVGEASHDS